MPEAKSKDGRQFNTILIVVDRLTKYAIFIPTRNNTTAVDFAELFFERIECVYSTPKGIVSDRDSRLTSEFWKEVCAHNMIKRCMSTAFHP